MTATRPGLAETLAQIGLTEAPAMLGMHLTEIEDEADTLLDLLILVRTHARTGDALAGQLVLVELVTALEHLMHHAQEALPALQQQLEIDLDDENLDDEGVDLTEATEKELQTV
jgi:hypothetical protein